MGMIWVGIVNGLREIMAHKVRTLLAVSGIVLGVAALVAMVGVLEGLLGSTRQSFESMGGIERVQLERENPPDRQVDIAFRSPGMTLADVAAIRHTVEDISAVSGVFEMGWRRVQGPRHRDWDRIKGIHPDFFEIISYEMEFGRSLSEYDLQEKARVIVLGPYLARRLFGRISPVGRHVVLEGEKYSVVGVIREEIVPGIGNSENTLHWKFRQSFIPITTAQERRSVEESISKIELLVDDLEQLPAVKDALTNTVRMAHNGILDFRVETREDQLAELNSMERNFKFSLGGIAAISLVVGGIGIMNVMLASVNERIREIGVRKAIGAQGSDVFIQFICESILISLLGCVIGMFISLGIIRVFQEFVPGGDVIESIPWNAMFIGFAFSNTIGILSGLYPAFRAAMLNPIEALRHE